MADFITAPGGFVEPLAHECDTRSAAWPPVTSPLPTGLEIDDAIKAHLAEFDAIAPEVRRTAWVLAALVQTLTPSAVLSVLGYAHLMARNERLEV